jgi:preprotein translocase subunit YajC
MQQIALWIPSLVVFLLLFIFLIIPKNRKLKKHYAKLSNIKRGDKVITSSGIYGTVVKIPADDVVILEIAPNCEIRIKRIKIVEVL